MSNWRWWLLAGIVMAGWWPITVRPDVARPVAPTSSAMMTTYFPGLALVSTRPVAVFELPFHPIIGSHYQPSTGLDSRGRVL